MFDAVPYLSNELVDPLGGYAELSSRFASGDGWLKKAKALQQPGCALSALASVGRNVPDQRLVSAPPGELVQTLLKLEKWRHRRRQMQGVYADVSGVTHPSRSLRRRVAIRAL